ncbi:unnamed protein product [Adineta steineri]|uniref:Uncharacterized protein n=1 Tax=Adineta steineri TaxID=433720 RepID=A0A814Q4H3_9BILA|nr:unnamed protein product [Adineta steineri]CAF3731906.1 unnamed protein product [Adineta steineri]
MAAPREIVLKEDDIIEIGYYGIRVFSSIKDYQKLDSNKSLGQLVFFLGLCLVVISGVDLSKLSWTLTQTEESIWPSTGKGIWIGFLVMAVGVFTLIAVREQTHSAFYILLPYTIVAIILCFFGLLTSIAVLQRYTQDPQLSQKENRNKQEGIQFALAALLIGLFALTFLFLSCLSCMICWTIPNFCTRYQGRNPQLIQQNQQGFPITIPLASPRTPHQRLIRNHRRPRFASYSPRSRTSSV